MQFLCEETIGQHLETKPQSTRGEGHKASCVKTAMPRRAVQPGFQDHLLQKTGWGSRIQMHTCANTNSPTLPNTLTVLASRSSGNIKRTLAPQSCKTFLRDTLVAHSCWTLLWNALVGHCRKTLLSRTFVERFVKRYCRTLMWDIVQ